MDQKLKNYSSGMQVRLAFSIAIRANTEILVLDEVLAVGDAAYQRKCFENFEEQKKGGKTVVLVTHDMGSVERFCTRALLIEYGDLKLVGSPQEVARQYTLDNMNANGKPNEHDATNQNRKLNDQVKSLDVKLLSKKSLKQSDDLKFQVSYELREEIEVDLGMSIIYQGHSMIEHNTKELKLDHTAGTKHKVDYKYALALLNPGIYEVSVAIFEKSTFKLIGFNTDSCSFVIEGEKAGGLLTKLGEWSKVNG
jgi:ABC-2 type transport system ATP-binding protein